MKKGKQIVYRLVLLFFFLLLVLGVMLLVQGVNMPRTQEALQGIQA